MFATVHWYELYSHWWDWFLVPIVFIYTLYSLIWVLEKSFTRFRAIGSNFAVVVGYVLLVGLVSGVWVMGWHHGYYNTPQNTPYETHTGGIWSDEHGQWHVAPTEYTQHDENTDRRMVGGECAILCATISLCLFVLLVDLIYLIRSNRGKKCLVGKQKVK